MNWWGSLKHKAASARELILGEWITLAEAWWLLGAISLSLRQVSLERLLERQRFNPGCDGRVESNRARAKRLQRIISIASRLHLMRMTCLVRALTLDRMLKRRGIVCWMCIGVNKAGERVEAHAWVEVEGEAIGEAEDISLRFKVLQQN